MKISFHNNEKIFIMHQNMIISWKLISVKGYFVKNYKKGTGQKANKF